MKLCCTSDLHGSLPTIPECDVLILAGDYCQYRRPYQHYWFAGEFQAWINLIVQRGIRVIGIAGNHDWGLFDKTANVHGWIYLEDSGHLIPQGCYPIGKPTGIKVWGTPWQPVYHNWAYNLPEDELAKKWQLIPADTDILVVHGPPAGIGDFSLTGNEHTGSPSLLARIEEIKPKLVVCGHIHEGFGQYKIWPTTVLNVCHMDRHYNPINKPVLLEI